MTTGLLPSIYNSENAYEDLLDYAGLYLRDEIKLEEEFPLKKKIVVCLSPHSMVEENGVEVYSIEDFLNMLWSHDIF